ncbi:MAG: DUF177 domain-containing protein [Chloroflexi bacterium]|nr:DUF177 domain-containing protein [Chloroflexota bacterium]
MSYVSNRVLKINVGFLLADGPGHLHTTRFDVPEVKVAEDLILNYVRGPLRLSRTKEGILVQGQLEVGINGECYRCLDAVTQNVTVDLEELFTYPLPHSSEFSVNDTAILDLGPLLRAEVLLSTARGLLCRPDCQGLCPDCGANLNHTTCTCRPEATDPRLAQLKDFVK